MSANPPLSPRGSAPASGVVSSPSPGTERRRRAHTKRNDSISTSSARVVVDDPVKELEDELKYYKSKLEMVGAATAEVRQTNAGLGKEVADLKELYTQTRRRDVAVLDEQTKVLQRQMNITQRDINVMEKTIQKLIRQGERYKTNTVALMLVMQHMMKETEELRATYDNEKQDMTADNLQYAFEILMRKLLEKISGIDIFRQERDDPLMRLFDEITYAPDDLDFDFPPPKPKKTDGEESDDDAM